jgi:carbon storage regulator CsrA
MLVLARRENDKLVFPNLGITVHVVRIDGKTVRLGVDAPKDVPVLRHEIADSWTQWHDYPVGERPKELGHSLRNRLNAASLGLHLLHRQLESGQVTNAEGTILKIFRELQSMEKEITRRKTADAANEGPPRRALLIEDNENECELLAGFLRTCNFEVTTARDGADALEYLAYERRPDVVLLDMCMRGKDGPSTVHEIRSNPQIARLKIFAITGLSPSEAKVQVGPNGVDRWFTKPIRPDVLIAEINRELHKTPSPAA